MSTFIFTLYESIIFVFIFMSVFFLYGLYKGGNDIADIIWGIGFIGVSTIAYINSMTVMSFLLLCLTTIWGLRLSIHIYRRNWNKDEDFRYKKWRQEWGKWFMLRSYAQVFLLQGVLMLLISLSSLTAVSQPIQHLTFFSFIGIITWCVGFFFEVVGDIQLTRFIANPDNKGKIMTSGIWRYTRHPNYFGEVTLWWGLFLITLPAVAWYIAIISPLTISFLILKVSGIPMLEKKYEGNPEFDEYKKKTNAFLPWFSRKI